MRRGLLWNLLVLTLLTLGATDTAHAQFPYFRTMIKSGEGGNQSALAVGAGLDFMTNAYILGIFDSSVTIGSTLNNPSPCTNIFIGKYNFGGTLASPPTPAWAAAPTIDTPLHDLRFGVHTLAGSPVIAGSFEGTNVAFGTYQITNASPGSSSDVFLGKFNSQGNASWLVRYGGTGTDRCGDLTIDMSGNTYLAGSFESSSFTAGNTTLTKQSTQGSDCFLIKTDPSGNVVWVKQGSNAVAQSVALEVGNSISMAGSISGAAVISGLTPTNPTTGQFFIKYDGAGNPLWCRGDMRIGNKMLVDRARNIVTAGSFTGLAQFQSVALSNNAPASAFIAKYDINGNTLWARHIPGAGNDIVNGIHVDTRTNYWVTGSFAPGAENENSPNRKMFVACYDQSGTLMGFAKASGSGFSSGNGFATYLGGFDFLCGTFSGEFTIGKQSLTNNGDSELILARLAPLPPAIKTKVNGNAIVHSWPNPTSLGFNPSESFAFEASPDLSGWSNSTNTPTLISGEYVVTNAIGSGVQFYRLQRP